MSNSVQYANAEGECSIQTQLEQGVLTVSIGQKDASFFWDLRVIHDLFALFQKADADEAVRVLIVQGSGPDFCAGLVARADTGDSMEERARIKNAMELVQQLRTRTLKLLSKPVIALVRGRCSGVGIRLIEGCDIIYAQDDSQFFFAQDELGLLALIPGGADGPSCMSARARSYYSICEQYFDGNAAEQSGLVTFSSSAQEIVEAVQSLAKTLSEKDPLAVKFTKDTLAHVGSMSWDASVNFTAAKFAELKALQAVSEGSATRASAVASFLAGKSKPGLGR